MFRPTFIVIIGIASSLSITPNSSINHGTNQGMMETTKKNNYNVKKVIVSRSYDYLLKGGYAF